MIDYVKLQLLQEVHVWIESLQNDLRMTFDVVHNNNNRFLSFVVNSD